MVSGSKSGSLKDALRAEVQKTTEAICQDSKHRHYLSHPLVTREQVVRLVRQLLRGSLRATREQSSPKGPPGQQVRQRRSPNQFSSH